MTLNDLPAPPLVRHRRLLVRQVHEIGEWFGFETRNKYQILDENQQLIGFAGEQQKGFLGFILRQYLGHWRKFDLSFFTADHEPFFRAHHPFRFFLQRLEIYDNDYRMIGAVQQRFSILTKRLDIQNVKGLTIMEGSSPIWRLWTFPFEYNGRPVANVFKKWSGLLELFTDKDKFLVEYQDESTSENERKLILAAALFIDLQYFEEKS
jgi:uncharacterized protein YxjI